jgi:hypothetical protein
MGCTSCKFYMSNRDNPEERYYCTVKGHTYLPGGSCGFKPGTPSRVDDARVACCEYVERPPAPPGRQAPLSAYERFMLQMADRGRG